MIQGPLKEGTSKGVPVDAPAGQTVTLVVTVDLEEQHVTFTVNGKTIEAALKQPLKSITHVGFAADSAIVDFAPVGIEAGS